VLVNVCIGVGADPGNPGKKVTLTHIVESPVKLPSPSSLPVLSFPERFIGIGNFSNAMIGNVFCSFSGTDLKIIGFKGPDITAIDA
jgi:hypothetical protein